MLLKQQLLDIRMRSKEKVCWHQNPHIATSRSRFCVCVGGGSSEVCLYFVLLFLCNLVCRCLPRYIFIIFQCSFLAVSSMRCFLSITIFSIALPPPTPLSIPLVIHPISGNFACHSLPLFPFRWGLRLWPIFAYLPFSACTSFFFLCLSVCCDEPSSCCFPGVYAYVILKDGVDTDNGHLKEELKRMVKKAIGSHAVPEMIQV